MADQTTPSPALRLTTKGDKKHLSFSSFSGLPNSEKDVIFNRLWSLALQAKADYTIAHDAETLVGAMISGIQEGGFVLELDTKSETVTLARVFQS